MILGLQEKRKVSIHWTDVQSVSAALVYWGTDALSVGYTAKGTRFIRASALFNTPSTWQVATDHGIPDPLHPRPYEGVYDPMKAEPTAFGTSDTKEVVSELKDTTVYKDDPMWNVPVPGNGLPVRMVNSCSGELTDEYMVPGPWHQCLFPRRGRPQVDSLEEEPEEYKERLIEDGHQKTYDEYDAAGRKDRSAKYPPADRHRGWWACSIVEPKKGSGLARLAKNLVIVICWVQQMDAGDNIIAWTISVRNLDTAR